MVTQFLGFTGRTALKSVGIAALLLLLPASAVTAQTQPDDQPLPSAMRDMARQDAITHDLMRRWSDGHRPSAQQESHQRVRDLIDRDLLNPGQGQAVGIRCVQTSQTNFSSSHSESFSSSPHSLSQAENQTGTIAILQGCQEVWIQIRTVDSIDPTFPDLDGFDDRQLPEPAAGHSPSDHRSWLTRPGSGWYWLLNR